MLRAVLWTCRQLVSQNLLQLCEVAECSHCELSACACTKDGEDVVCNMLLDVVETPSWGCWGDNDRSGKG